MKLKSPVVKLKILNRKINKGVIRVREGATSVRIRVSVLVLG